MAADKPQNQGQRNEGEGNRTAARQYNKAATEHAHSGKVEGEARAAEQALDGKEGEALRRAEEEGKRHAHGEDPKLRR